MPRVRADALDLPLLAVEREGIGAGLLHPECFVEAPRQLLGRDRAARGILPTAELPVETRHAAAGVQAVSLDLDQRDRRLGRRAVQMGNAVPGILPPLVSQAPLGLALVLDEPVAVLVAVLVDPAQGCLGRGKQLLP